MKRQNDILNKALDELRQRGGEKHVPKDTLEATLARLRENQAECEGFTFPPKQRNSWFKTAIAAVLIMAVGFAIGKISGPNSEQLSSEIEAKLRPQITEAVVSELSPLIKQVTETAVLIGCSELANEFSRRLRADVDRMGLQVLAASGTLTNQRLGQLIEAINAAQHQERRWIAAAFGEIESNRIEDKLQLTGDLRTLAFYTEDELQRTKQDFAKLIFYDKDVDSMNNEMNNETP